MKTAVCYARFSSTNQREESITAQLRCIYDYATKNNINIVQVYVDEAQSATTDDRPDFQNMIADLPTIKPDLVLVHKLDRFARDRFDAAYYRREIKKANARLIAVEQDFGEGPEAELMEGILEGFAEYFSRNLSREVKKGHTENALQGRHCGGIPPLGYNVDKDGRYTINEHEAIAVRLIFDMRTKGRSYPEIQAELQRLGYKSKTGRAIGKNSLHDILRNEKYTGTLVLRKTSPTNSRKALDPSKTLRVDNALPRIVDQEVFDIVQGILGGATHMRHHEDKPLRYWLTGIIRCGICGGAMSGVTVRKNKASPTRGYYQCGKYRRSKECSNSTRYQKDKIENHVLDKIEQGTKSIKNIDRMSGKILKGIERSFAGKIEMQQEIRAALRRAEKEFNNLTNAIASGADPRFLAGKINELGATKEHLKKELSDIGVRYTVTKQEIADMLNKRRAITFNRSDEESCIVAINKTVGEVIVFPEEIKIKPKGLI